MKARTRLLQNSLHAHLQNQNQHGVSLTVVMFILVVVSVLGVSATQISLMSQRAARSERDQQMAFQAAEAALVDAEEDIFGSTSPQSRSAIFQDPPDLTNFKIGCGSSGNTRGLCAMPQSGTQPAWLRIDLGASGATIPVPFGTFTGKSFVAASGGIAPNRPPRYLIEVLNDLSADLTKPKKLYRITAIGFGPNPDTQVVLQTIYRL